MMSGLEEDLVGTRRLDNLTEDRCGLLILLRRQYRVQQRNVVVLVLILIPTNNFLKSEEKWLS